MEARLRPNANTHSHTHTNSCPQIQECCRHPESTFLEKIPPRHPRTSLPQGQAREQRPPGKGSGAASSLPEGAGPRGGAVPVPGAGALTRLSRKGVLAPGAGRPHCGCVKGSSILWERGLLIRPCRGYAPQGRPTARCRDAPQNVSDGGRRSPGGASSSHWGGMYTRELFASSPGPRTLWPALEQAEGDT